LGAYDRYSQPVQKEWTELLAAGAESGLFVTESKQKDVSLFHALMNRQKGQGGKKTNLPDLALAATLIAQRLANQNCATTMSSSVLVDGVISDSQSNRLEVVESNPVQNDFQPMPLSARGSVSSSSSHAKIPKSAVFTPRYVAGSNAVSSFQTHSTPVSAKGILVARTFCYFIVFIIIIFCISFIHSCVLSHLFFLGVI
jgi:hypothetical protein